MMGPTFIALGVYFIALSVLMMLIETHAAAVRTARSSDDVVDAYLDGRQLTAAKHQGWEFNNE